MKYQSNPKMQHVIKKILSKVGKGMDGGEMRGSPSLSGSRGAAGISGDSMILD